MRITKIQIEERMSLIKVLFFDYKFKVQDIAEKMWLHRNTIGNYIRKEYKKNVK